MKTILHALLVIYAFGQSALMLAQDPDYSCGGLIEEDYGPKSMYCGSDGTDYTNFYRYQQNYIPPADQSIKYVKIAFHIWRDDAGNGLCGDSPELREHLDQVLDWINGWMANTGVPSDPIPGASLISDSRIRYVLDDVYFYNNTSLHNSSSISAHNNFLNTPFYKERLDALPIHFTINGGAGTGASNGSAEQDDNFISGIVTEASPCVYGYSLAQHLFHELAHNFRLLHTYDGDNSGIYGDGMDSCCPESCSVTNIDFLSDVFDLTAPNWCGTTCDVCYHVNNCSDVNSSNNDYCTNNIMTGHGSTTKWISPLQAGRMHRSSNLWSIRQYIWGYDPVPHEITSDETWDFSWKSYKDIVVKSGSTLTITCELQMIPEARIIVEPNARLIVDGGIITVAKYGEGLWRGIEVWGNKTQSQFSVGGVNAQGEVFLTNGAIIEHAEVAVRLIKPGDWNSSGGFIRAYNSTFRNNKKDVEFAPYSNDYNGVHYANKSLFSNVTFTWDSEFRKDIPLGHVTMWKVDGVLFSGCTFSDERITDTYTPSFNCVGIRSIDSKYRVKGRCTSLSGCTGEIGDGSTNWDPTIFENLYFGIYASNSTNLYTINVDRCQFIDNGYGIELISVPSPVIIRNQFLFTSNPDHFSTSSAMHGIHAINSKNLKIEENNFLDEAPGTHGVGTLGIVSSDLGQQNEENRNNTFTGVTYANYAQGLNRSSSAVNTGLQFFCNENFNNLYDHRVVGTLWGDINTTYGVKRYTGSPDNPVGTIFTLNGATNEDYYSTSDNAITYYYSSVLAPVQANIDMVPTPFLATCPSNLTDFSNGIGKLELGKKQAYINDFNTYTDLLATKEAEYLELSLNVTEIAYIMSEIDNLAPNNKQSVRDMLISYSPYLTTEILFEVADNAPSDFNHPWLRDLLIANIESVTDDLMTFLQTKDFPLPAPMREAVAQARLTHRTTKTDLEAEIAFLNSQITYYSNQLILGIQHDTDYVDTDSLRYWINSQNNFLYQQQIIDSYLQDGDLNSAKTEIDNLVILALSAPIDVRQEMLDFVKLKRWMLLILQNPERLATLGENDLAFLRGLASNGKGTARYQAQNILCFFYGECDPFYFEVDMDTRAPETSKSQFVQENIQPQLSVYPNPAYTWVMIEISPEQFGSLENVTVVITDLSGKVVHQTNLTRNTYLWETGQIEDGVYMISVVSNEVLFAVQKVIISK